MHSSADRAKVSRAVPGRVRGRFARFLVPAAFPSAGASASNAKGFAEGLGQSGRCRSSASDADAAAMRRGNASSTRSVPRQIAGAWAMQRPAGRVAARGRGAGEGLEGRDGERRRGVGGGGVASRRSSSLVRMRRRATQLRSPTPAFFASAVLRWPTRRQASSAPLPAPRRATPRRRSGALNRPRRRIAARNSRVRITCASRCWITKANP